MKIFASRYCQEMCEMHISSSLEYFICLFENVDIIAMQEGENSTQVRIKYKLSQLVEDILMFQINCF